MTALTRAGRTAASRQGRRVPRRRFAVVAFATSRGKCVSSLQCVGPRYWQAFSSSRLIANALPEPDLKYRSSRRMRFVSHRHIRSQDRRQKPVCGNNFSLLMGCEAASKIVGRADVDIAVLQFEGIDIPHGATLPTPCHSPRGLPPEARQGVGWRRKMDSVGSGTGAPVSSRHPNLLSKKGFCDGTFPLVDGRSTSGGLMV